MPALPGAPTTEIGVVNPDAILPPGVAAGTLYSSILTDTEELPELVWPDSNRVYARMASYPQTSGLRLAVNLAVRGGRWALDPNGCPEQAVTKLSEDLDLPIKGESRPQGNRTSRRFNWSEFTDVALDAALENGHRFFEQVGEVDRDAWWRLRKLSERPPRTLSAIYSAPDGGLIGIEQEVPDRRLIPVDRLVAFVWRRRDGLWTGRPMLRDIYVSWLKLDRLNRIDVIRHERNGAGIPWINVPPGAGPMEVARAEWTARQIRTGAWSGGSAPDGFDLHLKGVEGSTSDVLASIKHEEEVMARAWMAMLVQLGQTETGSRALGSTFMDFWVMGVSAIADWLRRVVQAHVIEDWIDFNLGVDASAPLLTYQPMPTRLAAEQLASLAQAQVIRLDDQIEAEVRETYGLPPADASTPPRPVVQLPAAGPGGDAQPGGLRAVAAAGRVHRPRLSLVELDGRELASDVALAAAHPILRRELTSVELSAGFDPLGLDAAWQAAVMDAMRAIKDGRLDQIAELADAVRAAGSQRALARVSAEAADSAPLAEVLARAAEDGADAAIREAEAQGAALRRPGAPAEAWAGERAGAVQELFADSLAQVARREALRLSSSAGSADVAASVEEHLVGLSENWLRDQIGGAVTAAQNEGRYAALGKREPKAIFASEVLDKNVCGPCAARDGHEYTTVSEARHDYPTGGFRDCAGGPRCRGTLVFVWS